MKKLILILLFIPLISFSQEEKLYGKWNFQAVQNIDEGESSFKIVIDGTMQFTSSGRYSFDGNVLYKFNWEEKEMGDLIGSIFELKFAFSGSWIIENGFLYSEYEQVDSTINDEDEIQFKNSDELDDYEKFRMSFYENVVKEFTNLKGTFSKEEIIALTEDVMVTKDENNSVTAFIRISN